jgi:hypothetical protein
MNEKREREEKMKIMIEKKTSNKKRQHTLYENKKDKWK